MTTKEWAEKNGLAEMYAEYEAECQLIADECMVEGIPPMEAHTICVWKL